MALLDLLISQPRNNLIPESSAIRIVSLFHIQPSPFQVCVLDVEEELGAETVAEFQSQYGKEDVIFIHCDITNKGSLEGTYRVCEV